MLDHGPADGQAHGAIEILRAQPAALLRGDTVGDQHRSLARLVGEGLHRKHAVELGSDVRRPLRGLQVGLLLALGAGAVELRLLALSSSSDVNRPSVV